MVYLYYGLGKGYNGKRGFKQPAVPTSYKVDFGRPPFSYTNYNNQFVRKTAGDYYTPMRTGNEGYLSASLSITDAIDTFAGNAKNIVSSSFAITEAADVTAITAQNIVSSSFTINEVIDTALITANAVINSSFAISEQIDLLSATAQVIVSAIISATESKDIAAFTATAGVARTAQFAITEPQDRAAFTVNLFKSYYGERPLWIIYPQLKPLLFERAVDIQASENPDTFEMEMLVTLLSRLQTSEERDTISMVVDGMHKERYVNDEMSLFMMAA
jgi:hypothetical protein